MFNAAEIVSTASTTNRSALRAAGFPAYAQDRGVFADREPRNEPHESHRNRGSYYVFRQGKLEMRAFDQQAIGW